MPIPCIVLLEASSVDPAMRSRLRHLGPSNSPASVSSNRLFCVRVAARHFFTLLTTMLCGFRCASIRSPRTVLHSSLNDDKPHLSS
ncbi:hypothetical protein VTN96DRAFT_942 [Rasamsonia emersonii]